MDRPPLAHQPLYSTFKIIYIFKHLNPWKNLNFKFRGRFWGVKKESGGRLAQHFGRIFHKKKVWRLKGKKDSFAAQNFEFV